MGFVARVQGAGGGNGDGVCRESGRDAGDGAEGCEDFGGGGGWGLTRRLKCL